MTLANRMGQSANCVSRFAFGMLGALAVGTVLLIAPSAMAEQTAAPASVASTAIPRADGSGPPLWVLRDEDSTVYLYGTVHLLRPGTAWGSAKVDAAFDGASEIWVEISNQDDQAAVMPVMQQYGVDPSRPLSSVLKPEDFAAFDALAKANGASGAALDSYRPWMAAFAVAMSGPLQAGYRAEAGVDKTLMDRARSTGKTLRGFETVDIQLRLIAGMSEEGQIAYLNHFVRNHDGIVPNLDQTVEAWIKGDVAEVGRLSRYNTGDVHADVHNAALIVRNADWTRQIEEIMAGSGTVFVAVGAAHLMDNDNVIDMLTAKGFTVERL